MPYALDPELHEALAATPLGALFTEGNAVRGDWRTLRSNTEKVLAHWKAAAAEHADVARTDHRIRSYDGTEVLGRWYTPAGHRTDAAGPAVIGLHGGGMIAGTVDLCDREFAACVAGSGVPLLAVDYRLAPEHRYPVPLEDSCAGLAWLTARAGDLGVDPARIAVMGDSAGGNLAAAMTLLARERGLAVAKQILVYPMLDDRNTVPDPVLEPFVGTAFDDNRTIWHAVLGDVAGGPDVPALAAPARAEDLSGLPPAYVEVGDLDIYRDESIGYARRLAAAGSSVELHVRPGCLHGFERLAPRSAVARSSRADRSRALRSF